MRGLEGRDLKLALALTLFWAGLLCWFVRGIVAGYFPVADDWALLANSSFALNNPLHWLTQGFSGYFNHYPGFDPPQANFIRPVFNLIYGLQELAFGSLSGNFLYISMLLIGICSGLTYRACVSGLQNPNRRFAFILAATLPLMPAIGASLVLFYSPGCIYDVFAACICLLAYLAYGSRRILLAAVLLLFAVFTKETSLPIAAAFLLHFVWCVRGRVLADPRAATYTGLLGMPIAIWLMVRFGVFHGVTNGIYVLGADPVSVMQRALVWPFWNDLPQTAQAGDSLHWLDRCLKGINIIFAAALGVVLLRKLLRGLQPNLAEIALLGSYCFMLLAGTALRYGAILDVFMVICAIRWLREFPKGGRIFVGMLYLATGLCVYKAALAYPAFDADLARMHQIGKRYAERMMELAPGEKMIVLNDPLTRHSRLEWMTNLLGVRGEVVKASDFNWFAVWYRPSSPCVVTFRADSTPARRFILKQSCGVELSGSVFSDSTPRAMQISPWATVTLAPGPTPDVVDELDIQLSETPVRIAYFDPADDDVKIVLVK